VRTYPSAEAFKQALEDRVRAAAAARSMDMARYRQLVVFDRFLARVFDEFGEKVCLKGGVALEVRLERARMTRDVDLRIDGDPAAVLDRLRQAGRLDLGDFLRFRVEVDAEHAAIAGNGVVYECQRFRVEATLAGKLYGDPFGVDVAFGDAIYGEPEAVEGDDFLSFIGVPRTMLRIYPRETHLAEKLHAYTLPRQRENSRVKDLVDIALLAESGGFDASSAYDAIHQTFQFRATHAVPQHLPLPPASWAPVFVTMSAVNGLRWPDLNTLVAEVGPFVNPILHGDRGRWDASAWGWR
jgi:hypothetical protein